MPGALARVLVGTRSGGRGALVADSDGVIEVDLPNTIDRVVVEWGSSGMAAHVEEPYREIYFILKDSDGQEARRHRLHNLSFWHRGNMAESMSRFRAHCGLDLDAWNDDDLVSAHDEGLFPANTDDGTRLEAPESVAATAGSGPSGLQSGTVVPKGCRAPRSLKSAQHAFDKEPGVDLDLTVRGEVHEAIDDIVAATGGNYELGLGFYQAVRVGVHFEMKKMAIAAQYEENTLIKDRIYLSDTLFGGQYPEARASVLVHEATHTQHGGATLKKQWLEGESYALDLYLAEELSRHFASGSRHDKEMARRGVVRRFDADSSFHMVKAGNLKLAVASHYVHYGVYRILHELREGRLAHFENAIRPDKLRRKARPCVLADVLMSNVAFGGRSARDRTTKRIFTHVIGLYQSWIDKGTNIDSVLLPRDAADAYGGTWLQTEPAATRLPATKSSDWNLI